MVTRFHLRPRVNGSHKKRYIARVLSTGEVERTAAQADTILVIAQYFRVVANVIGPWNIRIYFAHATSEPRSTTVPSIQKGGKQLTFTSAVRPPHDARAEAVRPIRLVSTGTVIRIRPATQARQLPALDPVEPGIKRDLVRDKHALKRAPARVPRGVKLRAAHVVVLVAARRILDLQHGGAGRVRGRARARAPGRGRVWEGVGDKGEVGPAVLDAALGEAPVGADKGLCGGIGLG